MRKTLFALALLLPVPALAGDHSAPPVTHAPTLKECGSCHMAFQPAFLPARSWERMMDGLADHFGEDARLPADKAAAIRAYLVGNAGGAHGYMRWVKPGGAPQRITENPAFLRKHDFRPEVWQRPDVVVKSNCPACHKQAEKGWYDDD